MKQTALSQPDYFVANCRAGLEPVVEAELRAWGLEIAFVGNRMVAFRGSEEDFYKANMGLRTALSVLKPLRRFKARNTDMLYFQSRKVNWHQLFAPTSTLRIDLKGDWRALGNERFALYRIKDAIVDTFKKLTGERPNIATRDPDVHVVAFAMKDEVTLYLDGAGEPLFKRGYRREHGEAPLKEDLAAGMLQLVGWTGETGLIDPMCGSGTLLFEGYLLANRIAPNIDRDFAFQRWDTFNLSTFRRAKESLRKEERKAEIPFVGFEADRDSFNIAQRIAQKCFPAGAFSLHPGDFQGAKLYHPGAQVMTNPPYGVRLKPDDLNGVYRDLGAFFKATAPGGKASLITAALDAAVFVGLPVKEKWKLFNGALECRLFAYDVPEAG
ncbi:MAG: THUMP domain-containing class I SAM-dependent RNA methyltransferase [Puniceicoccales bacterium]